MRNTFTVEPGLGFNFGGIDVHRTQIVLKTKHSVVFVNLKPFLHNHVLVSTRMPRKRLYELTEDEIADMAGCIYSAASSFHGSSAGLTIGLQDGPASGQSVQHVHFHMVPRCADTEDVKFDVERGPRTPEEMFEEARQLRRVFRDTFGCLYGREVAEREL